MEPESCIYKPQVCFLRPWTPWGHVIAGHLGPFLGSLLTNETVCSGRQPPPCSAFPFLFLSQESGRLNRRGLPGRLHFAIPIDGGGGGGPEGQGSNENLQLLLGASPGLWPFVPMASGPGGCWALAVTEGSRAALAHFPGSTGSRYFSERSRGIPEVQLDRL